MAVKNFSFSKEVKQEYCSNHFEYVDDSSYDENFPPLGKLSDDDDNVNKTLTKKKYNSVVKKKSFILSLLPVHPQNRL